MFYVGQTSCLTARLGDYNRKAFKVPTDFRVGTVIEYLMNMGLEIRVKYRVSSKKKVGEGKTIQELRNKRYRLVSDLSGYNYKTASKENELQKIREFTNISLNERGDPAVQTTHDQVFT